MSTTTEAMPREVLTEIIIATKTKGLNDSTSFALANAIVDALDRRGKIIADSTDIIEPPDAHLQTLKFIRNKIRETLENTDSGRDIASNSRRLQDVSREINALEERYRAADKVKGTKGNGGSSSTSRPQTTGPLDL